MSIPLVQNNEKDSINTSIIAIKKSLERINSLLSLADSSESDLSGLATKQEVKTYVDNNTQPKSKVWVAVIQDTGATALNLVGIVIPNASKVSSVGFQTIHRDGQSDPMQYVYVDLVNNSSFRLNNGMFNINMIVNGTYDSINDTWTITSRTATSLGFTTMKVNYSEDVTVKNS